MNRFSAPSTLRFSIFSFQFLINNQFSVYWNSCKLPTSKRSFQKPTRAFLFIAFCLLHYGLMAQTGCPDCVIALPDSLQEDTFYLQEFPDGQYRAAYDESITYRLPTNTSQILYLVPSVPDGIGIGELSIKSISNLPAGLSWEPNLQNYNLPDERDGCIRVCGTPLEFGEFKLEITVTAKISILTQDATFTRNFYIAPPESTNSGFKMTNNIGCGETTVTFENNNPSNGLEGYSYRWDFGLGGTTSDENPSPQNYTESGTYSVQYQAIIDTVGYILTDVTIEEAGCDDFLGKPDFRIRITDEEERIVFQNQSVDNTEPPLSFPLNLDILEGNYTLEVIDDDSGLGGNDDICGSINFNQLSNGRLEDGDLKVSINIFHPVDTIQVMDSVVVNPIPVEPTVSFDGLFIFCEGTTLELCASGLADHQLWYRDSVPINGATDSILGITEGGGYYISSINEEGCINTSPIAFFDPIPLPAAPVLQQESNLLSIFNQSILPDPHSLRWFQEGNLLETTYFSLCMEETGTYGVELTNSTSGCSSYFESVYTYDENGICSTSAEELLSKVNEVRLYPNPVQDQLTVDLKLNVRLENASVSIRNMLGQEVDYQIINSTLADHLLQFDMSDFVAGMYLVQLYDGENVTSWKVLKQ